MIERRIKELSIALKALSRIRAMDDEFAAIQRLLIKAIDEANKEAHPLHTIQPRPQIDDEIPF